MSQILDSIHNVMLDCKSKLKKGTYLSLVLSKATHCSSVLVMIKRYNKIRESISLFPIMNILIYTLIPEQCENHALCVTCKLQLEENRKSLDHLIEAIEAEINNEDALLYH